MSSTRSAAMLPGALVAGPETGGAVSSGTLGIPTKIDFLHRWIGPHFFLGALCDDASEMQHRDRLDHLKRHIHVVLDQQDRELRIQAFDKPGHLPALARRQPGG